MPVIFTSPEAPSFGVLGGFSHRSLPPSASHFEQGGGLPSTTIGQRWPPSKYSPPTASWDYGIPELVSCDIESVLVRKKVSCRSRFASFGSSVQSFRCRHGFLSSCRVSVWGCLLEGCPSKMRRTERRIAMKRATIQREKNQLAGRRRDSSSEGQICERLRRWQRSVPTGHIPPAIEKGSSVPTLTRSKQRRKSSLPQPPREA